MWHCLKSGYLKCGACLVLLLLGNVLSQAQCIPLYNVAIGCSGADDIDDFILYSTGTTSIIDTNTGCTPGSHAIRTGLFRPLELLQGETYTGIMTTHKDNGVARIWIDFNNDLIFQPSDSVSAHVLLPMNSLPYPFTITIPANADTGIHRMRVRRSRNSSAGNSIDPCALQVYGESHDYNVRITPAYAEDIGVYTISYPNENAIFCSGAPIQVKAVVKNYGNNPQSNFTIRLAYSGPASGNLQGTYNGTLNAHSQDTLTIGFTPVIAGNYQLNAFTSMANDQRMNNDTFRARTILVEQTPISILRDTAICAAHFPFTLSAGNTGCTYLWSTASNNSTIQATQPGLYTVLITSPRLCKISDTARITTRPLPSVAGIIITGMGNEFHFSPGGVQRVSDYYWDFGDGSSAYSDTTTHIYTAPGTYPVKLIVSNKCGTDTATFNLIVLGTKTATIALPEHEIRVYPNPASSFLMIQPLVEMNAIQLLLADSKGDIVYNDRPGIIKQSYRLPLAHLASGNYVLIIRTAKGNFYKMISVTSY